MIIEAEHLRQNRAGKIDRRQGPGGKREAMIDVGAVDIEAADFAEIIDPGGLRAAGRIRDEELGVNAAVQREYIRMIKVGRASAQ